MRRARQALLIAICATLAGCTGTGQIATIASVTDGDTFRLSDGQRIRIADIDSAKTRRGQAKCAAEIAIGLRQKAAVTAMLAGARVELSPVARSYNRIVARVRWQGRDLAGELISRDLARPWRRGQPKPDWCG